MKISVSGLSSQDLKLPIFSDPYGAGPRPAIRRHVRALPPGVAGITFTTDKPRMTEAATNSWLAVMTSLLLFASGMIAIAAMSGCTQTAHIPNILGGSGHAQPAPAAKTPPVSANKCPLCGEPLEQDDGKDENHGKAGEHGKHKGLLKDKDHHVCKDLNEDG